MPDRLPYFLPAAAQVVFNPTTSHMAYGGPCLAAAKAVGDAAGGGMVRRAHASLHAARPWELLYCIVYFLRAGHSSSALGLWLDACSAV